MAALGLSSTRPCERGALVGGPSMNDPIVEEVRRVRDAHAARFNYDLDAIFRDIKEREKKSGLVFVQGVARQPVPNEAPQPAGAALSVIPGSLPSEAAPVAKQ